MFKFSRLNGSGIVLLVALQGCVAPETDQIATDGATTSRSNEAGQDLSRSAIVTTGKPKLDPSRPSTFTWGSEVEIVGSSAELDNAQIKMLIAKASQRQIEVKGYRFLSVAGDFQLYATVVLDDAGEQHNHLLRAVGIDPGLAGKSGKGSLVLELKQGRALRWRGVVQIFTVSGLSERERFRRVSHAIAQLINGWPAR